MKSSFRFLQGALILALLALSGCRENESEFSLLFGGDIMLARAGTAIFSQDGLDIDPWGDVLSIETKKTAELFVSNLESPLGYVDPGIDEKRLQMNLCAPPEAVNLLVNGGIDLVTLANNHSGDCGVGENDKTSMVLAESGIRFVSSSIEPSVVEISRNKVAFFAVNAYSEKVDIEKLLVSIESAAHEGDLVVVSLHWGNEYQAGPDAGQELLAQSLVDAGVDILWGHHPHVLQHMEWKTSKVDGHVALVMYSLGNLLSDQWMLADTLRTALIRVTVMNGDIAGVTVIPLSFDRNRMSLRSPETETELEKILQRLDLGGLARDGVRIEWESEPAN